MLQVFEDVCITYHSLFHQIYPHNHPDHYILHWDRDILHYCIETDLVHTFQSLWKSKSLSLFLKKIIWQ